MDKNIRLLMPTTEAISLTGINEGNIETFKNTPMLSLTKEELQNSCDGRNKGNEDPVVVEFNDFYMSPSDLPDYDNLLKIFIEERDFWDKFSKEDKKAVEFFNNAISVLEKSKIRCLRISDKNTTGLKGVEEELSSPWNNLVINSNVSDKAGDDGGSFGIGKNAAFACTHLRLVFYNTINEDGEEAFEGVLKLPSYKHNDKNYVGIGFYSIGNQKPLRASTSLDPQYTRTEVGMDKYIVGFGDDLDEETLKKEIIVSSIQNFLYAFYTNKLIVKYNDIILDKEHLDDLILRYESELDAPTKEQYATLLSADEIVSVSVIDENDVKIYIKLDPDYDRSAGIIRGNGMKVFDMRKIHGRIGFSALVFLEGKNVNAYFKKLENPEHNQWAMDRAANRNEAYAYRRKITDPLKDYITKMHKENLGAEIDSDGMGEYLPYAYTHGKSKKTEGLSNEVKNTPTEKKKAKKKKTSNNVTSEIITYKEDELGNIIENTIDVNTEPEHHGGGGKSDYPGNNTNLGGDEGESINLTEDINGNFTVKKELPSKSIKFRYSYNNPTYILKMTSDVAIKKGFLEVLISTETSAISTKIINAKINDNSVKVLGGKILLEDILPSQCYNISFELINKGDWALEVRTYES